MKLVLAEQVQVSLKSLKFLGSLCGFLLLVAACADNTPIRAYEARGIVTEVPDDRESIVLSHDDISNYMPAMVMPFRLAHPDVAEGFGVGDEVLFQIVVTASGDASIVHMESAPAYSGPFPEFQLDSPRGEPVVSALLEDKVAIVNFWASWCMPCREEMPVLTRLQDEFEDQGLVVIGIAEDPENIEEIEAQIAELDIHYRIAIGDGILEEALGGVYQIPTTFILAPDGTVREKHIGLVTEDELRQALQNLL